MFVVIDKPVFHNKLPNQVGCISDSDCFITLMTQ